MNWLRCWLIWLVSKQKAFSKLFNIYNIGWISLFMISFLKYFLYHNLGKLVLVPLKTTKKFNLCLWHKKIYLRLLWIILSWEKVQSKNKLVDYIIVDIYTLEILSFDFQNYFIDFSFSHDSISYINLTYAPDLLRVKFMFFSNVSLTKFYLWLTKSNF